MRVLLVMTARTVGGAELYVQRLVAELSSVCDFTIALADHPDILPFRRELEPWAHTVAFNFDEAFKLPAVLRQLQGLALEHDLVHLNSNHPGSRLSIACGLALGGRRTPLVCVEHRVTPISDIVVPRLIAGWLPTLFRLSRRGAACVVAVSSENAVQLTESYRLPPARVRVARSGADLNGYRMGGSTARAAVRAELGLTEDQPLITTVARMSANKGHRYLVEAAPAILAEFPSAHFVFAGALDEAGSVRAQIAERGLHEHFSLLGQRSDVPRLLMASDVFVLPSLGEGFAVVLVEAMAAGLPVVATQVGGAVEIESVIGPQPFLQFVPPASSAALAQAVKGILNADQATRDRWGEMARAAANNFSATTMAHNMLALYREFAR